jgi:hypothetical protein
MDLKLQPGLVYLTVGTIEQIKKLFEKKEVEYRLLYRPTTNEMRRELEYIDPFSETEEVVIIVPQAFKATGLLKNKKSNKKKTEDTKPAEEEEAYLIPSDQYLSVSPFKYCFVLLVNALGEYTEEAQTARKKLEGGAFVSLDLRTYNAVDLPSDISPTDKKKVLEYYSMFPLSLEEKLDKGLELNIWDDLEKNEYERYIEGLLTLRGVQEWGEFNNSEVFKYFLNTNYKNIPVLVHSRAWCLSPYLQPIVFHLQNYYVANPTAYLHRFALWVYFSTKYWSRAGEEGLGYYKEDYKGKVVKTWVFNPSALARRKWLELTINSPKLKANPMLK